MRWDGLFNDLELQLEQELAAEELDREAEEERSRLGALTVRDRLVALWNAGEDADGVVVVTVRGGLRLAIRPVNFGSDWVAADVVLPGSRAAACIIPLASIAAVTLGGHQVQHSLGVARGATLAARVGLTIVLRDLCRRRRPVEIELAEGRIHGTIDRVGRDHVDVAIHEPLSARRPSEVTGYRIIPFDQVLVVWT